VCLCVCHDSCKEVSRSLMQMPGKCAHANYEKLCTTCGKSMESRALWLPGQQTVRQTDRQTNRQRDRPTQPQKAISRH